MLYCTSCFEPCQFARAQKQYQEQDLSFRWPQVIKTDASDPRPGHTVTLYIELQSSAMALHAHANFQSKHHMRPFTVGLAQLNVRTSRPAKTLRAERRAPPGRYEKVLQRHAVSVRPGAALQSLHFPQVFSSWIPFIGHKGRCRDRRSDCYRPGLLGISHRPFESSSKGQDPVGNPSPESCPDAGEIQAIGEHHLRITENMDLVSV